MSDANGSVGDVGDGGQGEVAEQPAAEPKSTIKPIPDSVWKRAKGPSESAVDSIIADSKREANAAKSKRYEVEEPDEVPLDKAVTRPDDTKGKEEIGADGRPRDAQGRFVAAETGAAPTQDKEASPKPATPAASSKYKFADQEYETQSAAEQAFRERDWHLARAIESANAWKAEAERRVAGNQPAPEPTTPQTPASAEAAGIDPEMARYVREAANEAGRPELYDQWLVEENNRILNERLASIKAELSKPQAEAQQREALQTEIVSNWRGLTQYTRKDGSPAFPEIGNQQAESQIGEYWLALGFPPELMRTQVAMMAAIGLYRMLNEESPQMSTATQQALAPAPPALTADAEAVTTGSPSRIDPAAEPESPEARRLLNALNRVGHRGKDANGRIVNLWSR